MSVYKEGYYAVELIKKQSKQLYADACDFGAPVKKGDDLWNWAKQAIDWYGNPKTRKQDNYGTGTTVSQVIELMDEWNTGKEEHFKITYTTTRRDKRMDGFLTVSKIR